VTETTTAAPADPNTGAGLIEFLDAAIDKGWFNVGSLKAMKTATLKIFEVESGWASVDLRSLDTDSLVERFRNLRRNAYSDDSIRVYKQRFGQALKMHLARTDGDPNWKTYGPSKRANNGVKAPSNGAKGQKPTDVREASPPASASPGQEEDPVEFTSTPGPTTPLMRFPFPLRDNVDVWLTLPRDLTKDEAERLSIFIGSLARRDAASSANSTEE
jgi:hypothetical protein